MIEVISYYWHSTEWHQTKRLGGGGGGGIGVEQHSINSQCYVFDSVSARSFILNTFTETSTGESSVMYHIAQDSRLICNENTVQFHCTITCSVVSHEIQQNTIFLPSVIYRRCGLLEYARVLLIYKCIFSTSRLKQQQTDSSVWTSWQLLYPTHTGRTWEQKQEE